MQNISVAIQIKENAVLLSGSACREQYVLSVCDGQENSRQAATDFLCFFSRSWLRLCRPSRYSLVSCSSAVSFWHFFFNCCTERCTSSLSVCRSASCSIHTHTHTHTLFFHHDSSMDIFYCFVYVTNWCVSV